MEQCQCETWGISIRACDSSVRAQSGTCSRLALAALPGSGGMRPPSTAGAGRGPRPPAPLPVPTLAPARHGCRPLGLSLGSSVSGLMTDLQVALPAFLFGMLALHLL